MIEIKAWLKETAKKLREGKKAVKEYQRVNGCHPIDWGNKNPNGPCITRLYMLRTEYRHKHIAYSLARGKTMEQIESKHRVDENGRETNLPNMSAVNAILMTLLITEEVTQ